MRQACDSGYEIRDGELSLILKNVHYNQKEFSNCKLSTICVINSKFTHCHFENLKVDCNATLGGGKIASTYIDCSFDNSNFGRIGGVVTFIRCTFRNVVIKEMFATMMEFIDCTFSGKLNKVVFFGAPPQEKLRQLINRNVNRFEGNDLSQLNLSEDIGFRRGIDFLKQKMPTNDNFLYLYDPMLVERTKDKLKLLPHKGYQGDLLFTIEGFELDMKNGQKHFILNLNQYAKTEEEKKEIITLFTDYN